MKNVFKSKFVKLNILYTNNFPTKQYLVVRSVVIIVEKIEFKNSRITRATLTLFRIVSKN